MSLIVLTKKGGKGYTHIINKPIIIKMEREKIQQIVENAEAVSVVLKNGSRYHGLIFNISAPSDSGDCLIWMKDEKSRKYVYFGSNSVSELLTSTTSNKVQANSHNGFFNKDSGASSNTFAKKTDTAFSPGDELLLMPPISTAPAHTNSIKKGGSKK